MDLRGTEYTGPGNRKITWSLHVKKPKETTTPHSFVRMILIEQTACSLVCKNTDLLPVFVWCHIVFRPKPGKQRRLQLTRQCIPSPPKLTPVRAKPETRTILQVQAYFSTQQLDTSDARNTAEQCSVDCFCCSKNLLHDLFKLVFKFVPKFAIWCSHFLFWADVLWS